MPARTEPARVAAHIVARRAPQLSGHTRELNLGIILLDRIRREVMEEAVEAEEALTRHRLANLIPFLRLGQGDLAGLHRANLEWSPLALSY